MELKYIVEAGSQAAHESTGGSTGSTPTGRTLRRVKRARSRRLPQPAQQLADVLRQAASGSKDGILPQRVDPRIAGCSEAAGWSARRNAARPAAIRLWARRLPARTRADHSQRVGRAGLPGRHADRWRQVADVSAPGAEDGRNDPGDFTAHRPDE